MTTQRIWLAACLLLSSASWAGTSSSGEGGESPPQEGKVTARLLPAADRVRVEVDGDLFTELIYAGLSKPILHPIRGPGGTPMVRAWPVQPAEPGESTDHPHHKGLWFNHGDVGGVDFWREGGGAGRIEVEGMPRIETADHAVILNTREAWRRPDGRVDLTSTTRIRCGVEGEDRIIDYLVTMRAVGRDVVFGDTKEGTMALRIAPVFQVKGTLAKGSLVTSEGRSNAAAWGSRARWVDAFAPTGGGVVGVACFDHPANLRHPTTWHVREYGLLAANPFGRQAFLGKEQSSGTYVLRPGEELALRYRWIFHRGDPAAARLEERWRTWARSGF